MKYFVRRSDGAYVSFEGVAQQQIIDLLAAQGMTCEFMTEDAFNTAVEQATRNNP
jgi:hypothetical protein